MTARKESVGKKILRIVIPIVVVAILLYVQSSIPAFADAEITIRDNCMTVINDNEHLLKTKVIVNTIDSKGNVTERKVDVEIGVGTFKFDGEYFQNLLETEDSVYIVETVDDLIPVITSYDTGVQIWLWIFLAVMIFFTFKICHGIIGLTT